jgi:hypothetical protein
MLRAEANEGNANPVVVGGATRYDTADFDVRGEGHTAEVEPQASAIAWLGWLSSLNENAGQADVKDAYRQRHRQHGSFAGLDRKSRVSSSFLGHVRRLFLGDNRGLPTRL